MSIEAKTSVPQRSDYYTILRQKLWCFQEVTYKCSNRKSLDLHDELIRKISVSSILGNKGYKHLQNNYSTLTIVDQKSIDSEYDINKLCSFVKFESAM